MLCKLYVVHVNVIWMIVNTWNHRLNWGLWKVKTLESRLWRVVNSILMSFVLFPHMLIANIYWVLVPSRHCEGALHIILLNFPIAQWGKALLLPVEHTGLERLSEFLRSSRKDLMKPNMNPESLTPETMEKQTT